VIVGETHLWMYLAAVPEFMLWNIQNDATGTPEKPILTFNVLVLN